MSGMEETLDQVMTDVMNTPGVLGVLCSDRQGLCVGCKGQTNFRAAGAVSSIAHLAAKLEPKTFKNPVVILESDNGNVMIQTRDSVTMAVYKSGSKSHNV